MRIRSLTDIGTGRKDNQDNYWCSRLNVNGSEVGIVCLCDGMGGLENGALASRTVVNSVRNYFLNNADFLGLRAVIESANDEIISNTKRSKGKSGTTCTILHCREGRYKIFHIGDTRCYKISGETVHLLTCDHNVAGEYFRKGIELPEDLKIKHKNSLTRCVGVKNDVKLDYVEGEYSKGDMFIVCSDGLWHFFESNGVCGLSDLNSLIKNCINSGETDNITICTVEV